MITFALIALSLLVAYAWRVDHRRLSRALAARDRSANREVTEVLPEVAQRAWLTTYSTLLSISAYPPFIDETADDYFGPKFTELGEQYRQAVHESQQKWFKMMDSSEMTPLVFSKQALSAFDEVFAEYLNEINIAHAAMMDYYRDRPMPIRNQDGFNWVKIW